MDTDDDHEDLDTGAPTLSLPGLPPRLSAAATAALAQQLQDRLRHGEALDGPAPSFALRQLRNRLVEGHLRLVMAMARRYIGRGLPVEDLVQEGNIGLMRAFATWDPGKARLSTYAAFWIKQAMARALSEQGRTGIPLKAHVAEAARRYRTAHATLHGELGYSPSHQELLESGLLPEDWTEQTLRDAEIAAQYDQTQKFIALDDPAALHLMADEEEMDDYAADAEESYGYDADGEQDGVVGLGASSELVQVMIRAGLTPRERRVLRLRYGLDDDRQRTLDEVRRAFGLSRERVRQIERDALRKLQRRIPLIAERLGRVLAPEESRAA